VTEREETPVYDTLPEILKETSDFLIVNKPSSIPVHPCGNFQFNTLQEILKNEFGYRAIPEKKSEVI
jgi:tRNA pseudouridine synthase 9